MTITIKKGDEPVWGQWGIKSATIYNQAEEETKMVVIDGFTDKVPDGYFVQSFNFEDFDKIVLEEK